MRIPAGRKVRDVFAVHRSFGRSTLRGSDRVTGQGQRDGHGRRRDDARDGPHSEAGNGKRGERGETRGYAIQARPTKQRQTREGEKAPGGGAR